ncbi:MAG TPA: hypothetical protein VK607_07295, partial [Kofleriaceae bacterium]|nr:hypothetical protein [Kofleriaceae bacterium]
SDQAGSGSDLRGSGSAVLPSPDDFQVLLSARNVPRFEVYENGVKLFDGPEELGVPRGKTRAVVAKAPGYRDKKLIVPATKRRMEFVFARLPSVPVPSNGSGAPVNAGSGSGHVYVPTPPALDCSNKILDVKNTTCVEQYCAKHPDEDKCHMM